MSQSELCVIECDGDDGACENSITADDWVEAHELAYQAGWTINQTTDLCKECS